MVGTSRCGRCRRICRRTSSPSRGCATPFRRGLRWTADYPEAELNFSWRLHQLTSVQVNPFPVIIDIDAGQLRHHPFLYVSEPSNMDISDEQARVLREYMLNGGFILMDDFWGGEEWRAFVATFKKIWPDRGYTELKPDHPVFHCVFDLPQPPQVHSNVYWEEMRRQGRTNMRNEIRPDAAQPIFRAVHDDRGRMVMLICLNNDMGDGWEQESFDADYFREVSEKHAYPPRHQHRVLRADALVPEAQSLPDLPQRGRGAEEAERLKLCCLCLFAPLRLKRACLTLPPGGGM
jgi:hypothetical protein